VQIKRIHAYKRQLMNALSIIDLYSRILDGQIKDIVPRTFIFAGKAAPTYYLAKDTIKLVNTIADKVNSDKSVNHLIKVLFLENYGVSLAEKIIPAADISEQLSTASKEASGTGNMKLMMNGAVTIGTMDGANIEIFEEVGADNMFVFGLNPAEVISLYSSHSYRSWDVYCANDRIRKVIDLLSSGFLPAGRHEFDRIKTHLLEENDEFLTLKDFKSYCDAQDRVDPAYMDHSRWNKMSLINIARSGRFSSDLTIGSYSREIWHVDPVK
jgi:starch phosphorylase